MDDKITVCIASTPDRIEMLKATVKSLFQQVDKIYLCLNNYTKEMAESVKELSWKIEYIIGDNSLGDAGKFYVAIGLKGYVFTCDDDIIYPPNYIQRTIKSIDKYNRKAVVSYHGRWIAEFPIMSYYGSPLIQYFCFRKFQPKDVVCHVLGTGCMAYHTDTIHVDSIADFPTPNMADIYFAVLADKKNVPLIALSKNEDWLKYMDPIETIFGNMHDKDQRHVELLNRLENKQVIDISSIQKQVA